MPRIYKYPIDVMHSKFDFFSMIEVLHALSMEIAGSLQKYKLMGLPQVIAVIIDNSNWLLWKHLQTRNIFQGGF